MSDTPEIEDDTLTDAVIARAFGAPPGGIPTGDAGQPDPDEREDDAVTERVIARQFPDTA